MFNGLLLHADSDAALARFLKQPSHATLLTGPRGIGTSTIAVRLAAALLDKKVSDLENAAYYRHLVPKDNSIPIEAIRNLNSFFRLSVPGKATIKRVVVIDSAEAMAGEAQNALLKLLEEPPEGTVILMVSSYPERLLATIRSRLSVLLLSAPTKTQVVDWFVSNGQTEAEAARAYLMTDGAIAGMFGLLTEGTSTSAFDSVRLVLSSKPFERLLQVDALAKDKVETGKFVAALTQAASASLERAAQNPDSIRRWQHILEAGITAQNALARNGNTKLVLTDLLLTL